MTSLVTTLTLLMAFNAIVFVGVNGQLDCKEIQQNVHNCVWRKWLTSSFSGLSVDQIKTWKCCEIIESKCAVNRVGRSDICKGKDVFQKNLWDPCTETVDNLPKRCPDFKTNPIEGNCKNLVKYMNCFGNTSSHLMSRPLIVFTPIVTLFVIYFFN